MRILLLCDDYYHPGKIPIEGIDPLKDQGFEFDIISDAKDFNPETMSEYPVILLCKSDERSKNIRESWKTKTIQKAFINYVEHGGGLLAVHSGIVAGKDTAELDQMLGSRFTYHPAQTPVTVQVIKPHPVTEGVEMFCEVDEHYRLEWLAGDADILMASYSPAQGDESLYGTNPHNTPAWIGASAYVRTQGVGRICVLTPGHTLAVWHHPQFQKLLINALNWCKGDE